MSERIPRSLRLLMATLAIAICGLAATAGSALAAGETVYSNIPAIKAGNYPSVGAEAYSYTEVGGQVELAGEKRNKPTVEVEMSSWACEFGTWYQETCESPFGKKVKVEMTLRLYEVGNNNSVGEEIGSVKKTFAMPYRPTKDVVHCTGGRWYYPTEGKCFNGFAFTIKFPPLKTLRLPKHVILGLSYNTSDHGPKPIGKQACSTKSGGCFYDSLNVALSGAKPITGATLVEPYIESTYGELTCNNAALATSFGPTECPTGWEGEQPMFKVSAH